MVKATPVRSERISFVTRLDGTLVGKGPSVSEGVTVQLLDELPFVEPVDVVLPVVEVLTGSTVEEEHAPISGATAVMPSKLTKPRFKNSLRSIKLQKASMRPDKLRNSADFPMAGKQDSLSLRIAGKGAFVAW